MAYVLNTPGAKFASARRGLKRFGNLPQRLRLHHAKRALREPYNWASRTAAYIGNSEVVRRYESASFQRDGFLSVSNQMTPPIDRFMQRWKPLCDEQLTKGSACPRSPWSLEHLLDDDTIRELIFHPHIVGSIAAYLGELPVFAGIDLWIGRKEELHAGSPFYHLDSAGWGNARFYVYLSDVDVGCGEFTYIPRSDSEAFTRRTGYLGDALSDQQVNSFFGADRSVAVTGKAGTGFLIDTTRCLHFGSRCTTSHRYALIVSYQRWSAHNSDVGVGPAHLKMRGFVPEDPLSVRLMQG